MAKNLFNFARRFSTTGHVGQSRFDVAIIGGGIVGLATALRLSKSSGASIVLVEKENEVGLHQSSHNSGVLHAGIYYQPGSDRANLCVRGLQEMYSFLKQHELPYKKCGKLIVAINQNEIPQLENLYARAQQNKCPNIRMIKSRKEIVEIEPHCQGIAAIHSPETGITDFHAVCKKIKELLLERGVQIRCQFHANDFLDTQTEISFQNKNNPKESITSTFLINCSGAESDRVAAQCGLSRFPSVIPIRGKWSVIKPKYGHLVKGNIYPVPNPRLPFLGVHFSKKVNSDAIWSGPNSVIAFSREGYRFFDFNMKDCWETATNPGFYKLLASHWKSGAMELYHETIFAAQLAQMKKYIPELTKEHFETKTETGVRAGVVTQKGELIHDFLFTSNANKNQLHVRNAPSPAATSCFAIAEAICTRADTELPGFPHNKTNSDS